MQCSNCLPDELKFPGIIIIIKQTPAGGNITLKTFNS